MRTQHSGAEPLLEEWGHVLRLPIGAIVEVMVDPQMYARGLRQVTPFAGVLTAAERARVYREFVEQGESET